MSFFFKFVDNLFMNLELNSKRVLITGSSKGIGFSIANHFLEEGANVILVARELENLKSAENELVKKYGENRVWSKSCDCTKSESLIELHDSIKDKFGKDIHLCECFSPGGGFSMIAQQVSGRMRTWVLNLRSGEFVQPDGLWTITEAARAVRTMDSNEKILY